MPEAKRAATRPGGQALSSGLEPDQAPAEGVEAGAGEAGEVVVGEEGS